MVRRRIPVVLSLAVVAVGANSALSGAAASKSIAVKDDLFSPKSATIAKNTKVTWKWAGSNPHNVTSRGSKRFKSSTTKSSGTYKVTFKKAGSFRYVCTIHDGMTGKIVVR